MIMFRLILLLLVSMSLQAVADIPRTQSGKPDLSGIYDTGTLTPTQRPEFLGKNESIHPIVARFLNWFFSVASELAIYSDSDPDREAPEAGGDGNNIGIIRFIYLTPEVTVL